MELTTITTVKKWSLNIHYQYVTKV